MKPEVRIVDNQQITTNHETNLSQSEVDSILSKYGYKQTFHSTTETQIQHNPQTFEEMVRQKESEQKRLEQQRLRRQFGPKSVSFDGRNINYSETKYSDLEVGNNSFGIKIEIVTDMKIN
jgi:hypothetical protein